MSQISIFKLARVFKLVRIFNKVSSTPGCGQPHLVQFVSTIYNNLKQIAFTLKK